MKELVSLLIRLCWSQQAKKGVRKVVAEASRRKVKGHGSNAAAHPPPLPHPPRNCTDFPCTPRHDRRRGSRRPIASVSRVVIKCGFQMKAYWSCKRQQLIAGVLVLGGLCVGRCAVASWTTLIHTAYTVGQ